MASDVVCGCGGGPDQTERGSVSFKFTSSQSMVKFGSAMLRCGASAAMQQANGAQVRILSDALLRDAGECGYYNRMPHRRDCKTGSPVP